MSSYTSIMDRQMSYCTANDYQIGLNQQDRLSQQEYQLHAQQVQLQLNATILSIQSQLTQRFAALTASRDARLSALPRAARDNPNNKGRKDIEKKWREGIDEAQVSAMVAQQTAHSWAAKQQQQIMYAASQPQATPAMAHPRSSHLARLRRGLTPSHLDSPTGQFGLRTPSTPQLILSEPDDDSSTLSGSAQSHRSRSPNSMIGDDATISYGQTTASPSLNYSKVQYGPTTHGNELSYSNVPMTATFPDEKSWRKRLEEGGLDQDQIHGLGIGLSSLLLDGKNRDRDHFTTQEKPQAQAHRRAASANTKVTQLHRRTRSAIVTSTFSPMNDLTNQPQEMGPVRQPRGPDPDPTKNFQARIRAERANDVLKMIGRRTKTAA